MDRKKEMIKTKGENVAAAEVERALNEHPGVCRSPQPSAFLIGKAFGVSASKPTWSGETKLEVGEEELKQWVGRRLADFKVPGAIHFIDQLPKTPLGKIQRQKLR